MTPEQLRVEVETLRTYKALCRQQVEQTRLAHELAVKEYNRARHLLANRVKKLRKEKEE